MKELLEDKREIWEIFTRQDEYKELELIKKGRFPYYLSEYRDILNPKVSEFLYKNGFKISFPDKYEFGVCLTHDVDNLRYPFNRHIEDFISHKSIFRFLKNPYKNLKKIIDIEKKIGAKSSFYLLANSSRYKIDEFKNDFLYIVDEGWEVGLHGGYTTFNNIEMMIKEKKILEKNLNKEIIGYRNHYLLFKIPDTWELLSKAGFKYDTTYGYPDMVGFRNGMCHPFKPFNLSTSKEINILEIPLTVVDGALFNYMHLDIKESWNFCKKIIDTVKKVKGVVTILWHNHAFSGNADRKEWEKLYYKILTYCYEEKAWITSGEEIYKWWKEQRVR